MGIHMPVSRSNIQENLLKCKCLVEEGIADWGLYIVIVLLAFGAFGLGRLSAIEEVRPPVSIIQAPELSKPQGVYAGGLYVASKTGSVYYFPWCAGGQNIAPEAQVWFKTADAAREAGYAPAKACKGLQ